MKSPMSCALVLAATLFSAPAVAQHYCSKALEIRDEDLARLSEHQQIAYFFSLTEERYKALTINSGGKFVSNYGPMQGHFNSFGEFRNQLTKQFGATFDLNSFREHVTSTFPVQARDAYIACLQSGQTFFAYVEKVEGDLALVKVVWRRPSYMSARAVVKFELSTNSTAPQMPAFSAAVKELAGGVSSGFERVIPVKLDPKDSTFVGITATGGDSSSVTIPKTPRIVRRTKVIEKKEVKEHSVLVPGTAHAREQFCHPAPINPRLLINTATVIFRKAYDRDLLAKMPGVTMSYTVEKEDVTDEKACYTFIVARASGPDLGVFEAKFETEIELYRIEETELKPIQ